MTDDPRDILRAAGVECAEVDAYFACINSDEYAYDCPLRPLRRDDGACEHCDGVKLEDVCEPAAILALARLVAKYKWQRDAAVANHCENGERSAEGVASCEFCSAVLADLDRRWEERDA